MGVIRKLARLKTWHFLLLSVVSSEILTLFLNVLQSIIRWGRIERHVIEIGTIDALLVSFIVTAIIIPLIRHSARADEALEASELQYRNLVDNSLVGIFRTNLRGDILYANDALARMAGFDTAPEMMKDNVLARYKSVRDRELLLTSLREKGRVRNFEVELLRRDRDSIFVLLSAVLEGEMLSGMIMDISRRKRAEEQIRMAKEEWEQTFDAMPDIVVVIDDQHVIRRVNRALADRLEIDRDELIGKSCYKVICGMDSPIPNCPGTLAIVAGKEQTEERFLEKLKGHYVISCTPISTRDVGMAGFVEVCRDISDRKKMEEELKKSVSYFKSLVVSMQDGFSVLDLEGKHVDVNDSLCRMTGYEYEELIGVGPPHPYWPAEEYENIEKAFKRTFSGDFEQFDLTFKRKDGTRFPAIVTPSCIKDEHGNIINYFATIKDITERKRSEEALRESEEKYKQLIEATNTGFVILDDQGRVLDANQEYIRMTGNIRLEDILGRPVTDWTAPYDQERNALEVRKCMETGSVSDLVIDYVDADGKVVPVEIHATVLRGPSSSRIITVCRDITRRNLAEEALKEARERFRAVFEQSDDGIAVADFDGRYVMVNPAFCRMTGYSMEELLKMGISDLLSEGAEPELVRQLVTKKLPGQREVELVHKDGRRFFVSVSGSILKVGENEFLHGIIHDITERKQAEGEIRRLNEALQQRAFELERAYKDMEGFNYAVSHDLKAPTRRIEGFSGILLKDYADKIDDFGRDLLNRIEGNAKKMAQLIEDLLAFSRVSSMEIRKTEIDMEDLTRNVFEELKPSAGERTVQMKLKSMPSVFGDASMVRQVIMNLLSNALKFTKNKDTAIIEAGGRIEGNEIIFFVRDNGIGFDMQFADKLFSLFQRIHISKEFEGTGVGLVTVKEIIEKHGGRVWAEGTPDKGAVFYFSLPTALTALAREG